MIKHSFDKDDLIREVESDTEIGKKIVEMHMHYLRSLKNIYGQRESKGQNDLEGRTR